MIKTSEYVATGAKHSLCQPEELETERNDTVRAAGYSGLQFRLACQSWKILQPVQTEQIKSAYEKQPYYARTLSLDWQLFRIRPASHPLPRLLKIATFLFDHLDTGLLNGFLNRVEADAVGSAKRFTLYKQAFHQPDKERKPGKYHAGKLIFEHLSASNVSIC
jgi:hypothetical protein